MHRAARMYRGLDGVIAATRRAIGWWAGLRIGVGPVRFCAQAAARRAGPRRAAFVHGRQSSPRSPSSCSPAVSARPSCQVRCGGSGSGTLGEVGASGVVRSVSDSGASGIHATSSRAVSIGPLVPREPGSDLRERFDLPESLSGELLDRVLGLLLDRLLARPERQGRTLRTVVLEAALVEGGTWRTRVVLREATADRASPAPRPSRRTSRS